LELSFYDETPTTSSRFNQQTFTGHDGTQNIFSSRTQFAAADVCTKNSPCRGRSSGPRRTAVALYVLSSTDKNVSVLVSVSRVAHDRVNFAKTVYKPSLKRVCVLLHLSLATGCCLSGAQFVNGLVSRVCTDTP